MNKTVLISVILIIVAIGLGFFGGMEYQLHKARTFTSGSGNFPGGAAGSGRFRQAFGGSGGQGQGFTPVRGQVLSVDSNTMTIKMSDGSSKIVVLSGSTVFQKTSTASAADIKQGNTVTVIGQQDSSGSVTAQNVSINPPASRQFGPSQGAKK